MEKFESWLERAVYLYLLLHIFSQLAAKEAYARYLRFFGRLCFLLFLLSPFFSIQKNGSSLVDLLNQTTCRQELENYRQDMKKLEYAQGNYYTDQYEDTLAKEVENQAKKNGYKIQDAEVVLNEDYEISQIKLKLTGEEKNGTFVETYRKKKKEALAKILADAFGVKKEVVQIA